MSDDIGTIIDKFVGDYESDGNLQNIPQKYQQWFPGKGVRMTIYKVGMAQDVGKAYAKVTISQSPAKGVMEKTVYRVLDIDKLVGQDLEIATGLLLTKETLVLATTAEGQPAVRHDLLFGDNLTGDWLCPKVS
jgi:hypothetical protein